MSMQQSIAGVAPPQTSEVTVMTVWPSLAAGGLGRLLGRLYAIRLGVGWLTLGKIIALLSIPLVLPIYFWTLLPGVGRRYRLTNRRVILEQSHLRKPLWRALNFVDLDRFDSIEVLVRPGQGWYPAGDLIFRNGQIETFRLDGVSRPETFRQTCLKARMGYVGVRKAGG